LLFLVQRLIGKKENQDIDQVNARAYETEVALLDVRDICKIQGTKHCKNSERKDILYFVHINQNKHQQIEDQTKKRIMENELFPFFAQKGFGAGDVVANIAQGPVGFFL